jgi:hypothetical protein
MNITYRVPYSVDNLLKELTKNVENKKVVIRVKSMEGGSNEELTIPYKYFVERARYVSGLMGKPVSEMEPEEKNNFFIEILSKVPIYIKDTISNIGKIKFPLSNPLKLEDEKEEEVREKERELSIEEKERLLMDETNKEIVVEEKEEVVIHERINGTYYSKIKSI